MKIQFTSTKKNKKFTLQSLQEGEMKMNECVREPNVNIDKHIKNTCRN